jgi:hypothetical protein
MHVRLHGQMNYHCGQHANDANVLTRSAACSDPDVASAFKKRLEKDVKPPAMPKQTIELLPLPASASDPQLPPVKYVMRTVLFLDCVGNEPLAVYGVDVLEGQSMEAVAELVRKRAMPSKVRSAHRWRGAAVAHAGCLYAKSLARVFVAFRKAVRSTLLCTS